MTHLGCDDLLHQGRADIGGVDPRSDTGLDIGPGEPAVVHFIINWRKLCALKLATWLVASTNIDQLIVILLAMATGVLSAVTRAVVSRVKVTIKCVIQGRTGRSYRTLTGSWTRYVC